jgi:hypothetical protein
MMKKTATLLPYFLSAFLFTSGFAQENKTCRKVYDKELKMKVYESVDRPPRPANENSFDSLVVSGGLDFKGLTKTYPGDQMVKIAYMIGTDGRTTFIKVISPRGDKDIEREARCIVSLIPPYLPGLCGMEPVACHAIINLPLSAGVLRTEAPEK